MYYYCMYRNAEERTRAMVGARSVRRSGEPRVRDHLLAAARHAAAGVSALEAFRLWSAPARGGVRTAAGPRENRCLFIRSQLRAEECPLSGVAPPLECCEGPPRADSGAVCGFVDRAKHFAVQLLEHCRKARPLLGIARAALRGELQQRPGAAREYFISIGG